MNINPVVIDISHYDSVDADGFQQARKFGIVGVIQKSSEGSAIIDSVYAARKKMARAAGLLTGAYHFLRPGNMKAQADFFLRAAQIDDQDLASLDFEVSNVSLDAAREFIERVEAQIGRDEVLYSGNTVKEDLGSKLDPWWGAHRLWLAQYSSSPVVQRSWKHYWLWQYTGDGLGPTPHQVPGITIKGGLDISHYDGTPDQLRSEWAGAQASAPAPVSASPPVSPAPVPTISDALWIQRELNKRGALLEEDGKIGPASLAAIRKFIESNPAS